jgi:hypothetical protein
MHENATANTHNLYVTFIFSANYPYKLDNLPEREKVTLTFSDRSSKILEIQDAQKTTSTTFAMKIDPSLKKIGFGLVIDKTQVASQTVHFNSEPNQVVHHLMLNCSSNFSRFRAHTECTTQVEHRPLSPKIIEAEPKSLIHDNAFVSKTTHEDPKEELSRTLPGKVVFRITRDHQVEFFVKSPLGEIDSFLLDSELNDLPGHLGFFQATNKEHAIQLLASVNLGSVILWKSASQPGSFGMLFKGYQGGTSSFMLLK